MAFGLKPNPVRGTEDVNMTMTMNRFIQLEPGEYVRQVWKKNSILFGLIRWNRLMYQERIGEKLEVIMDRVPDDVFINGVKYIRET